MIDAEHSLDVRTPGWIVLVHYILLGIFNAELCVKLWALRFLLHSEIVQLAGIDFIKFSLLRIIKLLRLLHGV